MEDDVFSHLVRQFHALTEKEMNCPRMLYCSQFAVKRAEKNAGISSLLQIHFQAANS